MDAFFVCVSIFTQECFLCYAEKKGEEKWVF